MSTWYPELRRLHPIPIEAVGWGGDTHGAKYYGTISNLAIIPGRSKVESSTLYRSSDPGYGTERVPCVGELPKGGDDGASRLDQRPGQ